MSFNRFFIYPPDMYKEDIKTLVEKFISLMHDFENSQHEIRQIAKHYQPHSQVFQAYTGSPAEAYKDELTIINKLKHFFSGTEPAPLTIANGEAAAKALATLYKAAPDNAAIVKMLLDDDTNRFELNISLVKSIQNFLPELDYRSVEPFNLNTKTVNQYEEHVSHVLFTFAATAIEKNTAVKEQDKFRLLNQLAELNTALALENFLEEANANDAQFLRYVIFIFNELHQELEIKEGFSIATTDVLSPSPRSSTPLSPFNESKQDYEKLDLTIHDVDDQIYIDEQVVEPKILDWRSAPKIKRFTVLNVDTPTPLSAVSIDETINQIKSPIRSPRTYISLADELREVQDDLANDLRRQIVEKLQDYINSRGSIDSEGKVKTSFLTKCFRNNKLTFDKLELTNQLIKDIQSNPDRAFVTDRVNTFIEDNEKLEGRYNKTYGCCTRSGLLKTADEIKGLLANKSMNFAPAK